MSQQFYDYSRARQWSFHQLRIINDHLDDPLRRTHLASDHAPLVAIFDDNPR